MRKLIRRFGLREALITFPVFLLGASVVLYASPSDFTRYLVGCAVMGNLAVAMLVISRRKSCKESSAS